MKSVLLSVFLAAVAIVTAGAQEEKKPVPKDSVRVFIPGCVKGYVFTAGRPAEDTHGGSPVPEGTHLRMAGPKKLISEIKAQEGSQIEITGLIKKGQSLGGGVGLGGGVRIGPGGPPVAGLGGGGLGPAPGGGVDRVVIDVEGWRALAGSCPR
jgi:hypothetical protein